MLPVPRAEAVLSRLADVECPDLRVWLTDDVLAIFRFESTLKSTWTSTCERCRARIGLTYSAALSGRSDDGWASRSAGPEGDSGHSVLGFEVEADRVVLLADPQVR